ncbi:MAG: efflux RND transporter periplasmic adaptor subunit [Acidobacteriota bacterium]
MTLLKLLLLCAAIPLLACGRRATESAPPTAAPIPAQTDAVTGTDPNTVRIDAGMLRDLRITTQSVESRPGGEQITLLGELVVDQSAYAEVGVPVAARVTRLLANAGDTVKPGQALLELNSPELGKARADHLSAEARVTLAEAALERKRGLAAENIVPLREVQEAESQAAEARAGLRSARVAVGAFGVQAPTDERDGATSSSFVLSSPIGGAVIERAAVIGQMLDPAMPAFRIGALSTLWLTVHAFERDAVRIKSGVAVRLVFPALPGQDFRGVVAVVGRQVERESRTVPVRINVRNAGNVLRPGMSATAALPVGASGDPILTVPVAAVQRVRNQWCVFLPTDASTFEIRQIGRGRDLGGEVEVLSGLRPGENLVVDGAFLLKAQAEKSEGDHDAH